jgi:hypothetical protein
MCIWSNGASCRNSSVCAPTLLKQSPAFSFLQEYANTISKPKRENKALFILIFKHSKSTQFVPIYCGKDKLKGALTAPFNNSFLIKKIRMPC